MEEKNQLPANNNDNGVQPQANSIIERADSLAKRLEEANKKTEELLKHQEDLLARQILSGRASAGSAPVIVDPEQERRDRINKMLASTGMKI